jgi:hypothetical protein
MNAVEHVSITIQDDFLERQTRAQPTAALAERPTYGRSALPLRTPGT